MKHVPRAKEPACHSDYLKKNEADASAQGAKAKEVWDRFKDQGPYKEARDALLAAQGALCVYCEQRLTTDDGALILFDQQIEHVLAKSGAPGRTLDWTNFALACSGGSVREKDSAYRIPARHFSDGANVSCGQSKGDSDLPKACDPREWPAAMRLVNVGLDGDMTADAAACDALGIEPKKLQAALEETLNLNCARLKFARKKVADEIREWIFKIAQVLLASSHLDELQREAFKDFVVAGRLQADGFGQLRRFWTTERQYLEPWSTSWIAKSGTVAVVTSGGGTQ